MKMKTEQDVADWVQTVDEATQPQDIAEEMAQAWMIVFGRRLADEDDDIRSNAWSHLCAAVC